MAGPKKTSQKDKSAKATETFKQVSDQSKGKAENSKSSENATKFLASMEKQGLLGNINKPIDFISTSNWVIDRCIGDGKGGNGAGGFPRGFMTEVSGKESTGKSTLVLQAIPGLQVKKELTVYGDFEKSLRAQQHYIRNMGINVNDRNTFIHLEPNTLQEGAKAIFEATIALKPAMVVVDSVAAMIPAECLTGTIEQSIQMGLHARLVSVFVGTMNKILGQTNTALVFINQLRAKMGMTMPGQATTDTTGGMAFKFYMSLRIQLAQEGKVGIEKTSDITSSEGKEYTDQKIKVTIIKNKLDRPFRSESVYLRFGKGFDAVQSLFDLATKRKVINGSGWYTYDSKTNPGFSFKIQGKEAVKEHLKSHPEVLEDMSPWLFPQVDLGEMIAAKQNGEIEEDALPTDMASLLKEMESGFSTGAGSSKPGEEPGLELG
jgi:recombination protein RecA